MSLRDHVKAMVPKGLGRSILQVSGEFQIYLRHRGALKKADKLAGKSGLKLHLGCGPNIKSGWVNIDLFHPSADLHLDLRERWPFRDGSVAYIYSEHVFEHFEFYREVPHFLSEVMRILEPGGRFDVSVPDTEWPLRGYGDPKHDYWPIAPNWHPPECETQLDHINYHFRQHEEHKYAWDEETLTRTLRKAGLVSIARRPFDATMDSESRKLGSLSMLAVRA
jgi:predicted SAM-dependent methyltransferase